MKKIILFTFLLLGNVQALALNSPYITSSLGMTNTSISIPTLAQDFSDFQILGNIAMGLEFSSKLRLETNIQLRTPGKASLPLDYRGNYGELLYQQASIKGELSSHAIMGNVFYKILEDGTKDGIWIGAGIGQMISKATLTVSMPHQQIKSSDTDSDLIWALYLLGEAPLNESLFFYYGIEFYQWKVFHQKINNISPRLGIRYML